MRYVAENRKGSHQHYIQSMGTEVIFISRTQAIFHTQDSRGIQLSIRRTRKPH
jgi:hypothetical protein